MEAVEIIIVGFLAGTVSGLFGVGGGVVFVPSLVFIFGLTQAEANATSLLAIVPVAIVGSYRQSKYGNVAVREGIWIGVISLPATVLAAFVANELPQRVLQLMFVAFALYVALRMARRALRPEPDAEAEAELGAT
ncbi:MAG: sulfite exporter TauE/SafE family protein [Thermoleophilaceae bacterium]|nr:sulfite exporter TauE/SafE family protein [Thermoleophilaceae bacterium]